MAQLTHEWKVYDDGSIEEVIHSNPSTGLIMKFKKDQDTTHQIKPEDQRSNKVRKSAPCPAVLNTGAFEDWDYRNTWRWTTMTQSVQFFWADLLSMQVYGKVFNQLDKNQQSAIITDFKGLTKGTEFLTNDKGTDTRHNYLNGENADKEDPQQSPLACCGDWCRVLQVQTNSHGIVMAQIDSFLESDPLPEVTPELLKDPRVFWATRIDVDGGIHPFPQLGGLPVPYPYITKEHYWYPLDDLEPV